MNHGCDSLVERKKRNLKNIERLRRKNKTVPFGTMTDDKTVLQLSSCEHKATIVQQINIK
jgi:hypothetical protein